MNTQLHLRVGPVATACGTVAHNRKAQHAALFMAGGLMCAGLARGSMRFWDMPG